MMSDLGCIVVVCGLPASGKSSLVRQLETSLTEQFTVVVVEYDLLLPSDVEKILIAQTPAKDASMWKLYREEIVACIDSILEHHCGSSCACPAVSKPQSVGDELWVKFEECCALSLHDKPPTEAGRPLVIIIDDNMYYRSMRYQYYHLARKHTVGFCQLYLDCSVEMAVSHNAKRASGQVEQDVIPSMAARFEPPNSAVCQWEKHSLKISSHLASMSGIQSLIKRAIEDPVPPLPLGDVAGREESQQICSHSVVHQADQILRRLITQRMLAAKGCGGSKDELKQMAKQLADKRLRILTDMKSGVVTLNLTIDVKDASKDSNSELYQFIELVFCSS